MALVPIPYTKNWEDVFGSQDLPTVENAASFGDTPFTPTQITSLVVNGNAVHLEWTSEAGGVHVDFGDGSGFNLVSSPANYIYDRMGDFGITLFAVVNPTLKDTARVRIESLGVVDEPQLTYGGITAVPWDTAAVDVDLSFTGTAAEDIDLHLITTEIAPGGARQRIDITHTITSGDTAADVAADVGALFAMWPELTINVTDATINIVNNRDFTLNPPYIRLEAAA